MELNKIKKAAAVQGMTVTSLAKEIGYSRAGFYSAVVNDTIMISAYKKMCDRLKVPFGTFVLDDDISEKVYPAQGIDTVVERIEQVIVDLKNTVNQINTR